MAQIVVEVSDEVAALAEQAAKKYGKESVAAWVKEWLRDSLVGYHNQLQTEAAQKQFNRTKRNVEAMFEEE